MSQHTHERGHRTSGARPLLAVVFAVQRAADALVIWFAFLPTVETSVLRGVSVGAAFWTAALLIGVWRRQSWARYLLIGFTWLYIAALSFSLSKRLESATALDPVVALVGAVALHLIGNAILIRSRRIRHFANR